jgi:DNA invertase Pin-like site-specific DNA recombinase
MNGQEKITASHLERKAFIYIRQSTLKQVREHRGSTERQYAQKNLVRELGWPESSIEVIDEDLGKSATSTESRGGFQRLVAEVAMGSGGAVVGIEVSRLARSNADWYKLLDLCASTDTLVIDDGKIHDPASYDDRLLLGLKGTMADSEIWMMLSRLQGGRYRKALDGEFRVHAPIGYVYNHEGRMVRDPNEQVSNAVSQFFKRFEELGVADRVVRDYWERKIKFPVINRTSKQLEWVTLNRTRAIYLLHNPVYTGAYSYGRNRKKKPRWAGPGPWPILKKEHTDAYISWEQFMKNKKRLQENRATPVTSGSPRRGSALLQGIVYCGNCGRKMGLSYQGKKTYYHYQCRVAQDSTIRHVCLSITGKPVDEAIANRCIEVLNRENVEEAVAISREVEKRHKEEEKEWQLRIEAAEYQAQRAFRQYDAVEPENRLVARTLEKEWEKKLEELEHIKQKLELWLKRNPCPVSDGERQRLLELVADFRQVWSSPSTTFEDQKALVRTLIKDVTISRKSKEIKIAIRWQSGKLETLRTSNGNAPNSRMLPAVIERIRSLSDNYLDSEIAELLNKEGFLSVRHKKFNAASVRFIRRSHAMTKGHFGEQGFYKVSELASMIGVSGATIIKWCEKGILKAKHQGKHCTYWIEASEEKIRELAEKHRRR